ncbi:MAG: efflux RND transporter periplasmic adaptor subunit [Candidatus Aminicenantes bacterium]|nr:efflux RND transporter periplasmic adaptor subunit [Candidatus Aminicenantes bacterium]
MKLTVVKMLAIILGLSLVSAFPACTKKNEEGKSMEQIYSEAGVPVRTQAIAPKEFKTVLSFNSELTGIKESTAYAAMGEKVEKILVKIGDYVKKDQVLLTFPTDSPSAQYFQAKVAFENAKTAFERIDNLYNKGGISLQDRDNAKARFDVAKADWDAVRQMVMVKAPISGYVSKLHVSETDNIDKEMPLVTISNTDKMKSVIWVSEGEIFAVREGMPATALWLGNRIEGKVVQVDAAMNMMNKAFRALVEFANPDNRLKAGTTVEIQITTSANPGAIVVERKDLLKEQDEYFVYVVNVGKAEKRKVSLGSQQGLDVEIRDGLNPGDELVVEGQLLLDNGSKVKTVSGK